MSHDAHHDEHREKLGKSHRETITQVDKLKKIEHDLMKLHVPPGSKEEAQHMDTLLGQLQDQHKTVQDHITQVRADLQPLLA